LVLYLPATHATQVDPLAPENPALQTQAVFTMLRIGEIEFAGQSEHIALPKAPLNVLIGQSVQIAPF